MWQLKFAGIKHAKKWMKLSHIPDEIARSDNDIFIVEYLNHKFNPEHQIRDVEVMSMKDNLGPPKSTGE